jgi:hypothetical protein
MYNRSTLVIENVWKKINKAEFRLINKGRIPAEFEKGELVLRRTNILSDADRGITSSLSAPYKGPYRLSAKISDNVLQLKGLDGRAAGIRNVDLLKHFHEPPR